MKIYSSASAKGFFIEGGSGDIPDDAKEITAEYRDELLAGEASLLKVIDWSGDIPALADCPAPTEEQLAARARKKRDYLLATYIDTINAVRWFAMTPEQQAACTAYRQALLDITDQEGFPSPVTYPDVPAFLISGAEA